MFAFLSWYSHRLSSRWFRKYPDDPVWLWSYRDNTGLEFVRLNNNKLVKHFDVDKVKKLLADSVDKTGGLDWHDLEPWALAKLADKLRRSLFPNLSEDLGRAGQRLFERGDAKRFREIIEQCDAERFFILVEEGIGVAVRDEFGETVRDKMKHYDESSGTAWEELTDAEIVKRVPAVLRQMRAEQGITFAKRRRISGSPVQSDAEESSGSPVSSGSASPASIFFPPGARTAAPAPSPSRAAKISDIFCFRRGDHAEPIRRGDPQSLQCWQDRSVMARMAAQESGPLLDSGTAPSSSGTNSGSSSVNSASADSLAMVSPFGTSSESQSFDGKGFTLTPKSGGSEFFQRAAASLGSSSSQDYSDLEGLSRCVGLSNSAFLKHRAPNTKKTTGGSSMSARAKSQESQVTRMGG